MKSETQRFLMLDALRGVAALAVVWGHLTATWDKKGLFAPEFMTAVDFFFMLSGFVIAHAYGERMATGMPPFKLIRIRFIRLYPLLILGALIGTVEFYATHVGHHGYTPLGILFSSLLTVLGLPTFTLGPGLFPINGPEWSLFFELLANIAYALMARLLTRGWLLPLAILAAGVFAIQTIMVNTVDVGWLQTTFLAGFARVGFSFTAGLVIHRFRPRFVLPPVWGLAIVVIFVAVLMQPFQFNGAEEVAITMVLYPAMIWLGSSIRLDGRLAAVGAVLGALSYPIYITHIPLLHASRDVIQAAFPAWHPFAIIAPVALVGVIGFAWMALKLIDEPVRAWLSRKTRPAPPPVSGALASANDLASGGN